MDKCNETKFRTMAVLLACMMAFGTASCAKKETTTEQSSSETFWPETVNRESPTTQKKETEQTTTASEKEGNYWDQKFEEGDERAGQSFEESYEGGDRAPDEIFWEQGDREWVADDYTLRIVDGAFYMDESILGMPYQFANEFFGGDLPLLDRWEWDKKFTGYCNYCYNGVWYTFFFSGESLAAVRYEVEGNDVEKFLNKYIDVFGGYGYRKDPNTGADIGLDEPGYGYVLNADMSILSVFLNVYDDIPHIAMQYEYPTTTIQTLAPEEEGNDSPPTSTNKPVSVEPLNIKNDVFFMDTFYLGCDYTYVNEKLGGKLPLLDAWEWDNRFNGYCDFYYSGHSYTLFFNDTTLAGVRYEFEGDDVERFLDPYIEKYGMYVSRTDPNTGKEIPLYENGYGYKFDTGEGSLVVFLNEYDGVPHVAMQYELW